MSYSHLTLSLPSEWVKRWAHLIPGAKPNPALDVVYPSPDEVSFGDVLDLACGGGRHMKWLCEQGLKVLGVDKDALALEQCRAFGEVLIADLETPDGRALWPLENRQFAGIVVTNYLWRPLFPFILGSLEDNAVLIYETFADGHQSFGRPSRPEFLLKQGELLEICANLRIIAYEEVLLSNPDRFVQRIVAINGSGEVCAPHRYRSTSR